MSKEENYLADVVVVDLGGRPAVNSCGTLLAQLGATVILVEYAPGNESMHRQWGARQLAAAGKLSVCVDPASPEDMKYLKDLLNGVDVVLTSEEAQPAWLRDVMDSRSDGPLLCDINSFGKTGPLSGQIYPEIFVQAITGLMDTTGESTGAPVACQFPLTENVTALYGVVGVLAALRVRREQGISQSVELALYDCALSTLTTFVPGFLAGRKPARIGNHHPSMSPWNAYRASDGWVLMCSGSDDQWRRVCELIGRPELATDERYDSPARRVQGSAEVDAIVEEWTSRHSVDDCVERFNSVSIACGPVTPISDLLAEKNLRYRNMVSFVNDSASNTKLALPGSVFRGSRCKGMALTPAPDPDAHRKVVQALTGRRPALAEAAPAGPLRPALEGTRVIEIGNYTAGPFVSRQLGALGAYVVKVEPPAGDLARALPPHRDGQSYFFTISNHDKRSLMLDLRKDADKTMLRALLRDADVLIENLRPGALARQGFSAADLARLNPRLVYCTISGYGTNSPYAERAGMDTTIQGAGGIMHLTQANGIPYKNGISSADIAAGLFALGGVLAALEYRDRTGYGQAIDISMQDAAAWMTHAGWNPALQSETQSAVIACADGYLVAGETPVAVAAALGVSKPQLETVELRTQSSGEISARLAEKGMACVPVRSVSDVMAHPQTMACEFVVQGRSVSGKEWPLLRCPLRLSATPANVKRAIGDIGADAAEIAAGWKSAGGEPKAGNAGIRKIPAAAVGLA